MIASIPIPFPVGATVWHASNPWRAEYEPCPDCDGTLRHEVRLGCGETLSIPCQGCGADRVYNDYPELVGRYRVYRSDPRVEQVTLADVQVRGPEIEYYSARVGGSAHVYAVADLFATEAEAMVRAKEKSDAHNAHTDAEYADRRRCGWSKKNAAQRAARLAGYWKREVARLRKQLADAETRVARCAVLAPKEAK